MGDKEERREVIEKGGRRVKKKYVIRCSGDKWEKGVEIGGWEVLFIVA